MIKVKFGLWALAGFPGWLLYFIASIPPLILGLVLVPVLAAFGPLTMTLRPSLKYPGRTVLAWAWGWLFILGNEEDGLDGTANGFWPVTTSAFKRWKQIVVWSAWRNSVGNARWLPFYGMTVDGSGSVVLLPGGSLKEGPYIARQGWRFEIRFCWNPKQPDWTKRRYFVCGWRIANTQAPESGVGFACQPRMTLT